MAAVRIPAKAGEQYTITESPPKRDDGHWELDSATAAGDGQPTGPWRRPSRPAGRRSARSPTRFVPKGSIILRKVTLGATATTAFVISPDFGTPVTYAQSATTTKEGVAVARDRRRHHGAAARHLSGARDDAVPRPGPGKLAP